MELLTKALTLAERHDLDVGIADTDCIDDEDKLLDDNDDKQLQNENVYNKYLPYDISHERAQHLMLIKASLAKCIQMHQEATYEWFLELDR